MPPAGHLKDKTSARSYSEKNLSIGNFEKRQCCEVLHSNKLLYFQGKFCPHLDRSTFEREMWAVPGSWQLTATVWVVNSKYFNKSQNSREIEPFVKYPDLGYL